MGKNYDLSQDKDYHEVITKFGGEEYLEENYPFVYKVFQNSRKYSQCKSFSQQETDETMTIGRQDIMTSCLVDNVDSKTGGTPEFVLQQQSHFSFRDQKACVIVDSTIADENGKVYGATSNLFENTYSNTTFDNIKGITIDHPYQLTLNTVMTDFTIDPDTGEPIATVHQPIQHDSSVLISSEGSVVDSVKVLDPVNKYSSRTNNTYIVYGKREDQYVSYRYENVPNPKTIGGKKYADIWCPFKVVVKLKSHTFFEAEPLAKTNFTVSLESLEAVKYGGGGVFYNNSFDNIQTSLSADKKELTINLSPDWKALLTVNDINLVIGSFKFYACFKVNYNITIAGRNLTRSTTVIASTDVVFTEASDYVAEIKIRWGCLGKDCILVTPQGPKKVSDLTMGDQVLTACRDYAKVTKIITGHEHDIMNIQLAGHDDVLQLTEAHGIETRRGLLPAGDLTFEDEVLTADKTYHPICYIEKQHYDDVVYNIETETHSMLVVNDMIVSEKETVREKADKCKKEQELPKELLAELRCLVENRNKGGICI